jgi:periplasmic protein TonB
MFADYISDNSWANRSHRGWTALASFVAQALAVAALLVLPVFYTQALPHLALLGTVMAPVPPPAPVTASSAQRQVGGNVGGHFLLPRAPISMTSAFSDADAPLSELPAGPGVPNGNGDHNDGNSVLNAIGTGMSPRIPPAPSMRPPRISHMMEGNLIRRVQPEYPALALRARVQGTVVLRAVIDRGGIIQSLQVMSGPPLLVQAAINAIRQWRYRPYYLNDQPVEVETQVTVNFSLSGG